jgi:hypothetical protein
LAELQFAWRRNSWRQRIEAAGIAIRCSLNEHFGIAFRAETTPVLLYWTLIPLKL